MSFDGLWAEEQLGGDLGIGLAVDDEARDLTLALGEGLQAHSIGFAGPTAAMDVMAEASQLALRHRAVSECSGGVELGCCAPQLCHRAPGLPCLRERPSRERPRDGGLDGGADVVRRDRGCECPVGGGGIAGVECDCRDGTLGHGVGHPQVQRPGQGLRSGCGPFGVTAAAERELAAGQ
jgi:hypothetical protein